ncbi:MAG: dTDP-4-amino-4,6-dideoxygalactose transaminase [Clostridia bacterium]|jgi:dTDP-4-amino-4,6-dideoxygalactose transaminase|nr:dTDP-4-amino-4,6-dideoxygalactose transaminase [Clostridia bacterium]
MEIPFNRPYYTGREIEYIKQALEQQTSGDGPYTEKATRLLREKTGCSRILLTTSGTHALEMAALLCGLQPGDEAIVPSFTFPSTANAIIMQGATPVFADIEEETLTIDPEDVLRKLTPAVKAVFPMHYGGMACRMDALMEIARTHNLMVVEDAAQAVNATYQNECLGTIGELGCFSFHATKNYSSGEGGALLVNTDKAEIWEKAVILRQKGTDRARFLLGQVDEYSWVDRGSNYTPSDILMAMLCAQLEKADEITALRKRIWDLYAAELSPLLKRGIKRMRLPAQGAPNYHLFYIVLPSKQERQHVQQSLKQRGVEASTHFYPLHLSAMGRTLGGRPGSLPVTERISEGLLRLPLYTSMTEEEAGYVVRCLREVLS